ncbi:MAG TPA: hypothetical protein VGJ92_10810 [Methanocella sp.]|jgi:hypothetical protein
MDKNKLITAGIVAILIIVLILVALFLANTLWGNFPQSKTNSIGFNTNPGGLGNFSTTKYAVNGNFSLPLTIEPSDDCMLVALVDYRAVPFYFNGSYGKTHYLNGSPTNQYNGTFVVTNLSQGYHDVVLAAFVAPANFTYDGGRPMNLMTTGAQRYNVIVDNGTKPVPVFENSATAGNATYRLDYDFSGPSIFKEPFDNRGWSRADVKPGQVLDYYLTVGHGLINGKKLNTSYAIVQLQDYNQVPVRYDTSDYVYYGYIAVNESSSVHLSLKAPDTAGPHRLVVLLATDPFVDREIAPGVMNNNITGLIEAEYIDLFVTG